MSKKNVPEHGIIDDGENMNIRILCQRYTNLEDSYRESLYAILQDTVRLMRDRKRCEKLKKDLVSRNIIKSMKSPVTIVEMLYVVEGATSKSKRKIAQKHARALTYLLDVKGCNPQGIAEALDEHGGIERVSALAAGANENEEKDRGAQMKAGGTTGRTSAKALSQSKARRKSDGTTSPAKASGRHQTEIENSPEAKPKTRRKVGKGRHDNWPKLTLYVEPDAFEKLGEANDNKCFRLVGSMSDDGFVARKVRRLKAASNKRSS